MTVAAGPQTGLRCLPRSVWLALKAAVREYAVSEFVLDGEPVAWQRPGHATHGGNYTKRETKDGKRLVADAFRETAPDWEPDGEGTFGLLLEFHSVDLTKRDADNLAKLVMDALNKVAYADDVQVADLFVHTERGVEEGSGRTCVTLFRTESNVGRAPRRRSQPGPRRAAQPGPPRLTSPEDDMLKYRAFRFIVSRLVTGVQPTLAEIGHGIGVVDGKHMKDLVDDLVREDVITYNRQVFGILRSRPRPTVDRRQS